MTFDEALPEVPVASTQGDPLEKHDSQMALEQLPVERKETMLPGCIEDMSCQKRPVWGVIASRKNIFAGVVRRFTGNELNPKKFRAVQDDPRRSRFCMGNVTPAAMRGYTAFPTGMIASVNALRPLFGSHPSLPTLIEAASFESGLARRLARGEQTRFPQVSGVS